MNMNGVHCQVSPTSTMSRADQASGGPRPFSKTEQLNQRSKRALLHIGKHAECVGDADRRHHQRARRTARGRSCARGSAWAQISARPRPSRKLNGDAHQHVKGGGDERTRNAAGSEGREHQDRQTCNHRGRQKPAEAAEQRHSTFAEVADQEGGKSGDDRGEQRPAHKPKFPKVPTKWYCCEPIISFLKLSRPTKRSLKLPAASENRDKAR
jgi:hypothetical protein